MTEQTKADQGTKSAQAVCSRAAAPATKHEQCLAILDAMLHADKALYEKILDSTMAYDFNRLCQLAAEAGSARGNDGR